LMKIVSPRTITKYKMRKADDLENINHDSTYSRCKQKADGLDKRTITPRAVVANERRMVTSVNFSSKFCLGIHEMLREQAA